jgi:hypothetical protein
MAYDRYDNPPGRREEGRDYRGGGGGGGNDDRGFFERARDEVQSWFGDDEAEQRRMRDERMDHPGSDRYRDRDDRGALFGGGRDRDEHRGEYGSRQDRHRGHEGGGFFGGGNREGGREGGSGGFGGGGDRERYRGEDRSRGFGGGQSSGYGRDRDEGSYRNQYGRGGGESGGFGGGRPEGGNRYPGSYGQTGGGSFSPRQGGRDYRDDDRSDFGNQSRGRWGGDDDQYRAPTGDYGRGAGSQRSGMGGQDFARSQYGRQDFAQDQDRDRGDRYNYGGWGDDDSRRQSSGRPGMGAAAAGAASYGASRIGGHHDEHYSSWRQRQIDELDQDYDAYRQEHRTKFENEFSGWRQQRQTKRQMLGAIREHDQVVDQNGEHIGTVDKVHGDTIILTRNDPEAGGVHRSFSCSLLERVEGGRVTLSGSKESIRSQLHEEREGDRRSGGGGLLSGLFGTKRDDERQDELRERNSQPVGSDTSSQTGEGPHVLDRSFSGTYEDGSDNQRKS